MTYTEEYQAEIDNANSEYTVILHKELDSDLKILHEKHKDKFASYTIPLIQIIRELKRIKK